MLTWMRALWLDISNLKRDDGNAGTQEFAGQKCSYICPFMQKDRDVYEKV